MADLSNWMETFEDKMDDKSHQVIFETLAANQFTSRLQLKLLTSDQVDMMFSKEQTLPLGAKSLLIYQLDFLKEESPLPVRARGHKAERMNIDETSQPREKHSKSEVETRRVSLHVF